MEPDDEKHEELGSKSEYLFNSGLELSVLAGEVAKPFLPLIGEALTVINEIVEVYKTVQYNKKSCTTLIDRVEGAEAAVKRLSRGKEENEANFRNREYYLAFIKFTDTLKRIKSFIKEVGSLSGFRNVIQANQIKERFQELIEDFDFVVNILKLAMIVSNEEQRKKDVQMLENELAEMYKYLQNIKGGITDAATGINTVLEEVEILNKKFDKLTVLSAFSEEFIPTEIPPSELEELKQKYITKGDYYKKWSTKLLDNVFCKKIITANDKTLEYKKIHAQLAILGRMQQSSNIIKFYGLSTANSDKILVFEWAEHGNLKEFYEKYEIDWPLKLQIAVNVCRGIAFLHGWCESILITEKLEPKISNFECSRYYDAITSNISKIKTSSILNWMAPEKIEQQLQKIYKMYTVQCEIFSFGMLLWELAFQKIPYKNYNEQGLMEYIIAGGREQLDFGLNLTSVQQKFGNVIKAAWQGDPQDRPEIKSLFNTLDELSQANEVKGPITLNLRETQKNDGTSDLENDLMPEMPNYTTFDIPYEPLLPLKEGIKAHRNGDFQKAWNCFVGHADNGNFHAKYWQGYYLLEGKNGEFDKEKGITLLKESADAGINDARFRYAFVLKDKQPFDRNEFVEYLTLAADNGLNLARFHLGDLYINRKLGLDNYEKGLQYLRLAALNNYEGATTMLKSLKVNM